MKTLNNEELKKCDIQGQIFEESLMLECSSAVFVRRFMNSDYAKNMDSINYFDLSDYYDVFDSLDEQYGHSRYGKQKYDKDEMFWIGYIYRYWASLYCIASSKVYKIIKPGELRKLYFAYHTLDPSRAIDRIVESKNVKLPYDRKDYNTLGLRLFRELRVGSEKDYVLKDGDEGYYIVEKES